ncbi:hypothetical protein ElyMa_000744400 [Elysia marginata]|uniref:Uncharacterized protein n=1 Tax=Elysia marginata TaxID=1093978 RepID=A0AAV4GP74_9GAST|nr:hypothetical protein ElyMa_000744400 [Elysia marginata]
MDRDKQGKWVGVGLSVADPRGAEPGNRAIQCQVWTAHYIKKKKKERKARARHTASSVPSPPPISYRILLAPYCPIALPWCPHPTYRVSVTQRLPHIATRLKCFLFRDLGFLLSPLNPQAPLSWPGRERLTSRETEFVGPGGPLGAWATGTVAATARQSPVEVKNAPALSTACDDHVVSLSSAHPRGRHPPLTFDLLGS